jgi:hypothetical protein
MKRPFLTFALAVVLPCGVVMLLAGGAAGRAWDGLAYASQAQVGRMVLASLEQDMGEAVDVLAARATPYADADPGAPAVQRAMEGDTVAGLTRTDTGAELAVVLGTAPSADGTVPGVRYAAGRLEPTAAAQVGRLTGYEAFLYIRGRLWEAGDGTTAPPRLDEPVLLELSRSPGGVRVPDSHAVLRAQSPQPGAVPAVVALVTPRQAPPPPVAARVVAVLGLLTLFALLAGWIQLARPPGSGGHKVGPVSVAALSLVPALTAALFLVHLTRTFEAAATSATVGDLTRGLAVASARGVTVSPEAVRLLTGFHATLVQSGEVLRSTYSSDPAGIERLPAPPASFTGSGQVVTPEGPSAYAALRRAADTVTVVTAPLPVARTAGFRGTCLGLGGALLAWLLLTGLWALLASRPGPAPEAGPEAGPREP